MHRKFERVINLLILPNSVTSTVKGAKQEKDWPFSFRSSMSNSRLAGHMFDMLALDPLFS